jgi:lysophospholipase L1-like esterase
MSKNHQSKPARRATRLFTNLLLLITVTIESVATAAVEPTIIALFGDSITVGYNLAYSQVDLGNGTTDHGLPTIELNELLNESSPKRSSVVSNWGDGGSSSSSGASRISRELEILDSQYSSTNKFVLIIYGTNDAAFGISTSTTKFNTQVMIDEARSLGYEPIIGTLTPVSNRNVQPRNAQIASAASSKSAFLVDHFARFISEPGGWTQLIELDNGVRLHPNDTGYRVIAETWFEQRLIDVVPIDKSTAAMSAITILLLEETPSPPVMTE